MQKKISLRLSPQQAADITTITEQINNAFALEPGSVSGFHLIKKSIDARGKHQWIIISALVFINEPFFDYKPGEIIFKDVHNAKDSVLIIGAGPAGLFAGLKLLEHGIRPLIIERGKDVRARRRDLALLNKEGIINPESNYCFGEGGAGTYSDGKLYTRSTKRGNIQRILNLFVQFGADEKILFESHPHIGTNKLPQIITAMRKLIAER